MSVFEPRNVDGHDAAISLLRQAIDEAVPDFATGPGDDDDGFAHQPRDKARTTSGSVVAREAAIAAAVASRHSAAPMK